MPDAATAPPPGRFRLMRFFMLTTVLVFAGAGLALVLLQREEERFFAQVQQQQREFFARSQAELAQRTEQAARASLLAVHEAAHVNLTRLVANTMWDSDLAPLVQRAQRLPLEPCRALQAPDGLALAALRHGCHAELGRRIMALPGFGALDRKAYAAMRSTSVFKIKVFDLRGITVYSSEHAQVGEDGAENLGWRRAAAGTPASELTHRERFSAFERVVEDRDLISSYVPVRAGGGDGPVLGVVELYSDVTPFLAQIRAANEAFARAISDNEARNARTSAALEREVMDNSLRFIIVVGGLMVLLYAASIVVVRIGQRIIDRQSRAQEQAAEREQLWQREKMAALAAMADNVSHEVGNPLAVISGLAQGLNESAPSQAAARQILAQTERIATMVRRIADFASARGDGRAEALDLNALVAAVCEFQAFDRRFRRKPIRFEPGPALPACRSAPGALREALMNLLQACADVADPPGQERAIDVATSLLPDGRTLELTLACRCPASGAALAIDYVAGDARYALARQRIEQTGGRIARAETQIRLLLPLAEPDAN